ncbi:YveK family protein [Clostridium aciditolerans]|uniref:Capsular biosynthesis protein n=1 Tax=Clostridium aciditolerans TaxID=339861 RepID=A0A934M1S9_9CLOT|nr:Wzz/FepE/Etk N-terminal domain-containing protein [Clostridium aciditolerans]MBI6873644.1 capsular biosynthesis protein [Clostridium aciditolerans]
MSEEMTIDLKNFFCIIKKRIKLILIITIACTLISGILNFFVIKSTYEASASIVIGKADNDPNNKSQYNYNDIMMFQKLVKTYAEIGKSRAVAENASARLKNISADKLESIINVTPQNDTQIVEFKVKNNSPQEAYLIMNAVTDAFIQESKRIYPTGSIQVMDGAKIPQKPIKPNKTLNVAIAFFIGLVVSLGLTFALEYMDSTIKTEENINRYLGIPVIGVIPRDNN